MLLNLRKMHSDTVFDVLSQTIVPRPVAWVLSRNRNGTYNLAPFSFYCGVSSNPPLVAVSVGMKSKTNRKDTWVNIEERGDFVIHMPSKDMARAVRMTAVPYPRNVSEIEKAHLRLIPVLGERMPRVHGPRVAMFCRKKRIISVGKEPMGLILGEVRSVWVDDSALIRRKSRIIIDYELITPLYRYGLDCFGSFG